MTRAAKAHWTEIEVDGVLCLEDQNDIFQTMTITNDAEAVVRALLAEGSLKPGQKLIYRDTEGDWDELRHDGEKFIGFGPLREREREIAIMKVKGHP